MRKSGEVVGAIEVPLDDGPGFGSYSRCTKPETIQCHRMNERSSRSHSVLIFNLTQVRVLSNGESKMLTSVLHCGFAGSERLKRSRALEGKEGSSNYQQFVASPGQGH